MSIAKPLIHAYVMYTSRTAAMPDTIAENRNTIGIIGVDHHGLALIDPKMNPTYPWSRNADGIPIIVTNRPTLSSASSEAGLMLSDPSASVRYISRVRPLLLRAASTMSF